MSPWLHLMPWACAPWQQGMLRGWLSDAYARYLPSLIYRYMCSGLWQQGVSKEDTRHAAADLLRSLLLLALVPKSTSMLCTVGIGSRSSTNSLK